MSIEEIQKQFKINMGLAVHASEESMAKTQKIYFTDLYFDEKVSFGVNGFDEDMTAKEQVMDYVADMGNDRAWIYVAEVPMELIQSYIEGLDEDEMRLIATLRGKPITEISSGWFNASYTSEYMEVFDNPFVLEDDPVPFKPCIVARKVRFNPVNLANLD